MFGCLNQNTLEAGGGWSVEVKLALEIGVGEADEVNNEVGELEADGVVVVGVDWGVEVDGSNQKTFKAAGFVCGTGVCGLVVGSCTCVCGWGVCEAGLVGSGCCFTGTVVAFAIGVAEGWLYQKTLLVADLDAGVAVGGLALVAALTLDGAASGFAVTGALGLSDVPQPIQNFEVSETILRHFGHRLSGFLGPSRVVGAEADIVVAINDFVFVVVVVGVN